MSLNLGVINAQLTADVSNYMKGMQDATSVSKKLEKQAASTSKAVEDFGPAIKAAEIQSKIFGKSFNLNVEKAKIFKESIIKLTESGLDENSASVKRLTAEYNKYSKAAKASAEATEFSARKAQMLQTATSVVVGTIVAVGAAIGAAGFAGIKMAGEMEKTAGTFEVLLGSAGAAKIIMEDLEKFADTTPFEFPEIATAAKNLLALGLSAQKIPATMQTLGDISAAVNIPFSELADIYGKINVQGRVFAEDINQLQGRGIPVVQEMAKQFGVSREQIMEMVSDGKIGFKEVEKALAALTAEGGKFHGRMDKLSKTLPGLMSTMMDSINKTLTLFGQKLIEVFDIKGAIKNISDTFAGFNKQVKEVGMAMAISNSMSTEFKVGLILATGAMVGLSIAILSFVIPALVTMATAAIAAIAPLLPFIAVGAAVAAVAFVIYAAWESNLFGVRDLIMGLYADFVTFWNGLGTGSDQSTEHVNNNFSWLFDSIAAYLRFGVNAWYKFFTVIKNTAAMIKSGDFSMEGFMSGMDVDFASNMFSNMTIKAKEAWTTIGDGFDSAMTKISTTFDIGFNSILEGIFGKFEKQIALPSINTEGIEETAETAEKAGKKTKASVDKIAEAFKTLQSSMDGITGRAIVFGKSFDVTGEIFKATETAINNFIDAGMDPLSEVITSLKIKYDELKAKMEMEKILKDQTEAVEALTKSYALIEKQVKVFGDTFDGTKTKMNSVETALNKLLETVDENDERVVQLRKDYEKLNNQLKIEDGIKVAKKAMEDLAKKMKEIDVRAKIFGDFSKVKIDKIAAIKEELVRLTMAGEEGADTFKKLENQLTALEKPRTIDVIINTMQQMGGSIAGVGNQIQGIVSGINGIGTSWTSALGSFKKGGLSGILGGIGGIGSIVGAVSSVFKGIGSLWSSFSGSKAKKQFYNTLAEQSAANKQTALEMMEPYKQYAVTIRNFGKNSLVSIREDAERMTAFLETMTLTETATAVSQRIRKYFGHKTIWGTLWTYSFDEAGAQAATTFLNRFTEIASGLSSSVGSAFSNGIKAFLSGKADWTATLKEGIRDAIIDAITTAVMQATIIKGALGGLLGDLAAMLTTGADVSPIITAIGNLIPKVAAQLENVLTPLRNVISSAFPGDVVGNGVDPYAVPQVATNVYDPYYRIPAMATGGIVSRPTMAMIGEAGPEAVVPLSKMESMGGEQTIIIQLDGRTLTQAIVKNMPAVVRMKTGVTL